MTDQEPDRRAGRQAFVDRYEAVGLRHNPFSLAACDPSDPDLHGFISRGLPDPPPPGSSVLVQIIGEKGAGKTTYVHRWRRASPGPYHYIPKTPYRQRFRTPPVADLVYGDEIDRQPAPLRRRWFRQLARRRSTVVIGTHVDLSSIAGRAGLDVVTHHLGPVDRDQLESIFEARFSAADLQAASPGYRFTQTDLDAVHSGAGGSVRDAEHLAHGLLAEQLMSTSAPDRTSRLR